jgi:hypothetical protein
LSHWVGQIADQTRWLARCHPTSVLAIASTLQIGTPLA